MSRDIKFRAWSGSKRYDNGAPVKSCVDGREIYVIDAYDRFASIHVDCIEQFTGLRDCNSVKIFEGDIVSVDGAGAFPVRIDPIYGVIFEGGDKYDICVADCIMERDLFTVIGNIHQNPEMLEQCK